MRVMKLVRIGLWALVLVVGATVAGVYVGKTFFATEPLIASGGIGAAFNRSRYDEAGGPFTLIDTNGKTVTDRDLAGKPRAMFFGFTHCPDVCPTTMLDAADWLRKLGPDADRLEIVFVSVDPERDTPEILKAYLGAFDDRIIGLTATDPATIRAVADAYRITYEKVPLGNGSYTMNHSADTLLFDRDGKFAGFIPFLPQNLRQNEAVAKAEEGRALSRLRALIDS
jgi:protein SCO1/2